MPDQIDEFLPGLYSISSGGVHLYLLDNPGSGMGLVDAGLPGSAKVILDCLRSIGRAPADVRQIYVTHADVDHVGGLQGVVEATGAKVFSSAESVGFIRNRHSPPHISFPVSIVVGIINAVARRSATVDATLSDGDSIDVRGGLRAIATPGHTQDHTCYYLEREGVLFAGDLFRNFDRLELYPRFAWNTEAQFESGRRILALALRAICPGHGQVWLATADPEGITVLRNNLAT